MARSPLRRAAHLYAVAAFEHRTGTDALSAMRKVCAPGKGHTRVMLTRAERVALDAWLAARHDLLVEAILHDGLSTSVGHGGGRPPRNPCAA